MPLEILVLLSADQLLEGLTPPQTEAVTHIDGPLLIIAGAGSGKTRVITRRVAYLISQGIPAHSILAITFTNKAAGEMKHRVGETLGRAVRDFGQLEQPWPTICTFHSLCLRILRHYAEKVGLPRDFTIYDSSDQTKVIKEAMKSLDVSTENFTPGTVHSTISNAKNQLLTPELFAQNAGDFYGRVAARVYTKYQALLTQNNALDFDDLLLRTAHAYKDHPEILKELQARYQYVMIDEYQDTNHAQFILAHSLASTHRNMCVVGDPDQSIYAWRGADIRNILDFETHYPEAKVVKLEQNYRSTKTILALASKLIENNSERKKKDLWTDNDTGPKADLVIAQSERDEADAVMHRLKALNEQKQIAWSDMAIFYRMNSLSRVMEEALFKAKIPYQIARGVEFYNRKEIKDLLAYLRLVANPSDDVSLDRIANVPPRGLGDAAMKTVAVYAAGNGITRFQALCEAPMIPGFSSKASAGAKKLVDLVRRWRGLAYPGENATTTPIPPQKEKPADEKSKKAEAPADDDDGMSLFASLPTAEEKLPEQAAPAAPPRAPVRQLMEDVVRHSGYAEVLKKVDKDKEEGEKASDNVYELVTSAAEFDREQPEGTLTDYLAAVSLVSDADHMRGAGGAITLMTLHAAKGLEFPVVAIIGLEEGVLPHSRARDNFHELEEERRLFFVGITRAERKLIISRAQYRTVRGMRDRTVPSPFLKELPEALLDVDDRTTIGFERESFATPEPSGMAAKFRQGMLVRHQTFGLGRIVEVADAGGQTRATVNFNSAGTRRLILEYANLQAVG